MTYLDRAIQDKHAQITEDHKGRIITYLTTGHRERYDDPEEQVRAEFWAELIYHYQYPPHRIGIEITVPDRLPKDSADLIVFADDERKAPYIVVECKREKISAAEFDQAIEQAFGNGHTHKFRATYVMVVAGTTRRAFDCSDKYPALEREKNIIADLPKGYGKVPEWKYFKGGALDISPVSKDSLIAVIDKCHQTLWGGGKLSPPAAFGELCKLVFAKISDEKAPRRKGEPYTFQIRTHEPPHVLAARIRELYDLHRQKEKDHSVFDETIKLPDWMLSPAVSHLQGFNLSKTDLDTKGVAFEKFMDGFFKGNFGQYFTPREVIQFAVALFPPSKDQRVLDPACGSGGFLLHALDEVRHQADEYYPDHETDADEREAHRHYWHDFAQNNLFGIEINDEIARVAKMNMILHDDGHTNVIGEDALERY